MAQNYLAKNTDYLKFILNIVNSSSIFSKKKRYNTQSIIAFLSLFSMLICGSNVIGQTTTVNLTSTGAGTWTVPTGVTSITVEAWGAGGAGGGVRGINLGGSGGSGGTYTKTTFSGVTAGTIYNLYVAPTTNIGSLGTNGANGADSWFNTSAILNANGGLGGKGGTSNGASVNALNTGSLGTGTGTVITAGGSTSAGTAAIGSAGGAGGGAGGGTGGTAVGVASNNSYKDGNSGSSPGGGGSGSTVGGGSGSSSYGGAGARGEIRITFTCPTYIVSAGSNQTLSACATTTTLSGSAVPAGTVGTWSLISGTATITTPSSPTSGISGLVIGTTTTLRWTISNGTCGNTYADVTITTVAGPSCLTYCTPTYSTGPGTGDQITNVTLGSLNNPSGASASPYYTFYSALTIPNLLQSSTASISITFGADGNQYAGVWIDFNQDSVFQSTEGVVSSVNAGANGTTVINIPIPAGASLGNTRMRVRGGNDSALLISQACGATASNYGETEDYKVNITAAPIPTITSLGSASGCIGASITINGTNLIGATAVDVKIGGTAVSSITSNTGTQIVAVIGTGTTGVVSVTAFGSTATSTATFTVNPLPIITAQPVAPAVVCVDTGTRNISVSATGAATYQWQENGVNISASAPYSGTNTATLTITNPAIGFNGKNLRVIVSNTSGCSVISNAVALSVTAPTQVSSSPVNVTIAPGANASFTTAATNNPTSYLWEVSVNSGGAWSTVTNAGVYSNATTATLNITAAPLSMNSNQYRVKAINSCGTSSASTVAVLSVISICNSTGQTTSDGITGVNFNTINNLGTAANVSYSDYTAISTTVAKGNSYNLNLYINTGGAYTNYQSVYIDWNGNGNFSDTGEFYNLGTVTNRTNGLSSGSPLSITVPTGAMTGSVRMRVQSKYGSATTGPCQPGFDGEVEDYTINIKDLVPCTIPTAHPTALVLSAPTGETTITGIFTATTAPDGYLVVISTSSSAPTPVNGTTYTIGGKVETSGYLLIDSDNNVSFSANGLTSGTAYYIYIFPFNSACSGGPFYNTASPLNGTATTAAVTPVPYCSPSTTNSQASGIFINNVSFVGTLNDVFNLNTSYSLSPNNGYQNFASATNKAIQTQGEGVNISVEANVRGRWKAWVDWNKNGTFNATEQIYDSAAATLTTTFGFVIPVTAAPGDYRIRIRIYNSFRNSNGVENVQLDFTPCETFDSYSQPNSTEYGEAEDYLFTVVSSCSAIIKTVTNGVVCGSGRVDLAATGSTGVSEYKWYTDQFGVTPLENTTTGFWKTPSITTTKTYWVEASNGSCISSVRTPVIANVSPLPILSFDPPNPQICGENEIIKLTATGDTEQVFLINENFEGGGLSTFSNSNLVSNPAVDNQTMWKNESSTFIPNGLIWFPAISSNLGSNKFVMATSDVGQSGPSTYYKIDNALVFPVVSSNTFTDLRLSFRMYYSRYFPDGNTTYDTMEYMQVQVSTNGTTWATVNGNIITDKGIGTRFLDMNYDLTAYVNQPNLRIRIRYYAESWCDGAAIDDIKLYGTKPLASSFNWSSTTPVDAYIDSACLTAYKTGTPIASVYIKPTLAQLELGTFTFTASALLTNGCSVSTPITVTNTTKIWQGTSTDWNSITNWLPSGVPTLNNCVIIPNTTIIPGSGYKAYAKNLTVKSTGNLELTSTSNLTVTDFVKVNTDGIFNIRDKASLIQINDVANQGIVNIERTSQPMYNIDYTYWNSPLTLESNFTLGSLSPNSPLMFSWIPTVSAGTGGNWKNENNATIMDPRKGYIIRAPTTFSSLIKTPYTATFKGIPNNGTVTAPIIKGTLTGVVDVDAENDEWNLIGNPYPSAIDAGTFVDFNANLNVIDGTIYVWTHNTAPSQAEPDPFYGDYALNYTENDYASFNRTGGVSTRSSATTGGSPPSGFIASGQSFFVRAANTMAPGTLNATFNNSMRVGVEGKNGDFFKMNKNQKNEAIPKNVSDIERHRIWLNLTNNSGAFSQILVGYIEGATQSLDRSFDGESFGGNDVGFYTIIPEAQLTIQGRSLPFDENDQVKLGYYSELSAKLSVRIDHFDGLFDNQNILLEDKELGIIHDLKDTPYVFQTEIGDFDDRFILRYTDKSLSLQDPIYDNAVTVFFTRSNNTLNIKNNANDNTVLSASLYDIQGKLLSKWDVKEKEQSNIKIPIQDKSSAVYIVKLKTEKGTISKKIIVK
jgi:hypothetical protein